MNGVGLPIECLGMCQGRGGKEGRVQLTHLFWMSLIILLYVPKPTLPCFQDSLRKNYTYLWCLWQWFCFAFIFLSILSCLLTFCKNPAKFLFRWYPFLSNIIIYFLNFLQGYILRNGWRSTYVHRAKLENSISSLPLLLLLLSPEVNHY